MCHGYILYNNAQCTTITKIKVQLNLHSQTTHHASPLQASYGVSFTSYTQNNDRDISGAQCITQNRTVKWIPLVVRNILNRNVPLVASMDTTKPPPSSSQLCKLSTHSYHMSNICWTINVVHGLKHESMPCKPCSPIYTYVSCHIRVCYCRLNISTKEQSHICALYTPNVSK